MLVLPDHTLLTLLCCCWCCAVQSIDRLRGKVEGAVDMPILEFGPDAQAILTRAVDGAKARIAHRGGSSKASRAEEARAIEAEVVAELDRRMEPLYRQHVEALAGYFSGKFQDRFNGLFCPVEQYNRETAALLEDVCNTFDKACRTAVPKALGGQWGYRETLERLREDLEVDIVDKRIEVMRDTEAAAAVGEEEGAEGWVGVVRAAGGGGVPSRGRQQGPRHLAADVVEECM